MRKTLWGISAVSILLAGVWFLLSGTTEVKAAAACTWTASTSQFMNDLTNWDDGGGNPCPGFSSRGLVFNSRTSTDAYNNGDFYFYNLKVDSGYTGILHFQSGYVSSTNSLEINDAGATVNFYSGTMEVQGGVRVDSGNFNGADGTGLVILGNHWDSLGGAGITSFYDLTINGGYKTLNGDVTSTHSFINNGTLDLSDYNFWANGDFTNNATITLSGTGNILKEATGGMTQDSYNSAIEGNEVVIEIYDPARNYDAFSIENYPVYMSASGYSDMETLLSLVETTASSGIFTISVPLQAGDNYTPDNGILEVPTGGEGTISLDYYNPYYDLYSSSLYDEATYEYLTAPEDQDDVFTTTSTVNYDESVLLDSTTNPSNFIWFAPYSLGYTTSSFVESATMTMAVGTSTTIEAPDTPGAYRLYVVNNEIGVSDPSSAILFVRPNNENITFSTGTSALSGSTTTIAGNLLEGTYVSIFATSGATMGSILANMPDGGNGSSSTESMLYPFVSTSAEMYVPLTAGSDYKLFTAYYKGAGTLGDENSWVLSNPSSATLTVTPPVTCYWAGAEGGEMSNESNWGSNPDGTGSCTFTSSTELHFSGTATTTNATNSGALQIAKIVVESDYSGTITLSSGNVTSTNGILINGGTVSLEGGNLYLGGEMTASGGSLNSSLGTNIILYGDPGNGITGGKSGLSIDKLTVNRNVVLSGYININNELDISGPLASFSCADPGPAYTRFYGTQIETLNGGTFDPQYCYVSYFSASTTYVTPGSYLGLMVNSPDAYLIGTTSILSKIDLQDPGVLNVGNNLLTFEGNTDEQSPVYLNENTVFNADSSTIIFDLTLSTEQEIYLPPLTYHNLTLNGEGVTYKLYDNLAVLTNATSTGSFVNNATLDLGEINLWVLGDYDNYGITTYGGGGVIKKEASGGFTASSYDATGPGGSATITVTAKEQNFSAFDLEKIGVGVTTTNGDSETFNLWETSSSSGQFSATISFADSGSVVSDNGTLDIIGATGTMYLDYPNDYGPLTGAGISAEFDVITAPDDQDDLFTTSSTVEWNSVIPLTTSTAPDNFIWFAPYSLGYTTSSFVESATMTMAVGTSTTIEAPDTPGAYHLYVINNDTGVSDPSLARLAVRPTNQDLAFAESTSTLAGATTTIAGNTADGYVYGVFYAPPGLSFAEVNTYWPAGEIVSGIDPYTATTTQLKAPTTPSTTYRLFTYYNDGYGYAEENYIFSDPSSATLTVTPPTNQDTVFPVSTTIERTGEKLYVTINPSGFVNSQLWFVTSTELTSAGQFIEGGYMIKTDDVFGTSTQANAPDSVEDYHLYIIDQYNNVSGPSDAILTIVSSSNNNINQFWVDLPIEGTVYGTITESASPTISMRVATSTDVTSLTPGISLESSLSTVDPADGVSQNFTNPVNYTVTAENGTQKVYVVSIIPYADMAELDAKIATATALHDGAIEGTLPGQYAVGSKTTLNTAIVHAQGFTSTSLQAEVDAEVTSLQSAIDDFEAGKVGPDTTPPVITKNNGDMNIYVGTVYTDPGATAYDAVYGTTTVDVINPVNTSTPGIYIITYTATDVSSNTASTTRTVEVLAVTTTAQNLTTSTQASTSTSSILVGDNSTATSTVTIPDTITSTIYLDISATSASSTTSTEGLVPGTITVNASTTIGVVQVTFPAGMTVTAPTNTWDGTIALPTIEDNSSVSVTPDSGYSATVNTVVALGFGDTALTFDKAVRILIPGKSGYLAGYYRGTTFTKITATCSADTQVAGDALAVGGDCKINVGSDLVIWTKHFTDYVAYTQTYLGGGGGGSSGGGAATPAAIIPTAGLNPVLINAGAKTTVSRFVNLSFNVSNATQMAISESSAFLNAVWETYLGNKTYTLSAGNGFKTIYSKFKSSSGGMTSAYLAGITLMESTTSTVSTTVVSAECTALYPGDMIKVVGKPAIYVLDNNLNYRYFSDGDVYKSWNNHEKYVYKAISQTCFNSLSQPSSAPYHVFYRSGSHVVRYLSSDKLYVVGLNNTLYPITASAAKAIFGTNYVIKVIGLSEWPYYAKSTEIVSSATVYPGMLAKIDGKNYFVDEDKSLREVDSAGMVANQFKTAYVRPLPSGSGTGLPTGEKIMSLMIAFSTPLGL